MKHLPFRINTGPKVIKLSFYSQLSMKFILPMNVKMLTMVGILTVTMGFTTLFSVS